MKICRFILLLVVGFCSTFGEDGHDGAVLGAAHEHQESIAQQCEESGGHFCFDVAENPDPKNVAHCYKESTLDSYCKCIEGTASIEIVNKTSCTSTGRKGCFEYKESLRAYYRGVCYTEAVCKGAVDLTWKGGDHASCAHVADRCARIADANYNLNDKECTCTDPKAAFHTDHCHAEAKQVGTSAKWGYGIIATAVISLFAVVAVVIVLLRHQWWYSYLLSTMVALAMGCLLSDATLHLIPLSLGLHGHDDEGHEGHGHGAEKEEMSSTERRNITIAITAGVYLFLLFEKGLHLIIPHQHSHGGDEEEVTKNPAAKDYEMKEERRAMPIMEDVASENGGMANSKPRCNKQRSFVDHLHEEDVITRDGGICSVDSVAWMVIFGDALHNFADGLVMGAAFTNSLATGLGTSIAVFCHEVPHELGDFAVLLNAGMKIKFAVIFNFLSACACFLGLFVGLAIGENEAAQKWVFAFTAGMFIYIACADLIPLMDKHYTASKRKSLTLALQHLAVLTGFLTMWLLAVFEADIEQVGLPHNH